MHGTNRVLSSTPATPRSHNSGTVPCVPVPALPWQWVVQQVAYEAARREVAAAEARMKWSLPAAAATAAGVAPRNWN